MMHNFSILNSPFNNRYYPRNPYQNNYNFNYFQNNKTNISKEKLNTLQKDTFSYKKNDEKEKFSHHLENDSTILNIFGISLHLDDIILLLIIYFLYTEDNKDDMLFVVLILLLLS